MKRVSSAREEENNVFAKAFGRVGRALSNTVQKSARGGSLGGERSSIPFTALVEKRVLGTGTFGTVKLMQDGRNGKVRVGLCTQRPSFLAQQVVTLTPQIRSRRRTP
jgi:hypothetical protein